MPGDHIKRRQATNNCLQCKLHVVYIAGFIF